MKPIIMDIDEGIDVNSEICEYFHKNYGATPKFNWEYVEDSADPFEEIRNILRKYFEYDDNGYPNESYDPSYSPSDAIDDIHNVVGKI